MVFCVRIFVKRQAGKGAGAALQMHWVRCLPSTFLQTPKRNIGEISEYSKEEAEIGTLALGGNPYFRKRTNPEWPSARRGEGSRREGGKEREVRGK